MTRKRFIKLLMGRYGLNRNEARYDTHLIQNSQRQRELTNRAAKTWGMPKERRLFMHGYEYIYSNFYRRYIDEKQ